MERFPIPVEIVAPLKHGVEMYSRVIFGVTSSRVYCMFSEVCLTEATVSRRHVWCQALGLVSTCAILLAAKEKRPFNSSGNSLMREFLYGTSKLNFSGMRKFCFRSEDSQEIATFLKFYFPYFFLINPNMFPLFFDRYTQPIFI